MTAVDGEIPNVTGRAFLVWFIQKYEPRDHVTLSVLDRSGHPRDLTYQVPPRAK